MRLKSIYALVVWLIPASHAFSVYGESNRMADDFRPLSAQHSLVSKSAPPIGASIPRLTPDDPGFLFGLEWNLDNGGLNGTAPDFDIDGPEGWAVMNDAGDVIVAVLDSGVRYTHEDLAANMWVNATELPGNGVDDDQNGYIDDVHGINALDGSGDPIDDYHHGTLVAGIIGAAGNNGKGGLGVAWRVKIMACKILNAVGIGTEEATIAAIDYARAHGARIINASWNYPDYSAPLRDAIARARDAGIIFVCSAGNGGVNIDETPSYPPSYGLDNIITVTSVDSSGQLPVNANFGAKSVHIAAPGATIYAPWHQADNSYAYANGTSMAAPHVAGVCALAVAQHPSESHLQIIQRLLLSAKPMPALAGKCQTGGIASLVRALDAFSEPATNSLAMGIMPTTPVGSVILTLSGTPGSQYEILTSTNLFEWESLSSGRIPANGGILFTNLASGNEFQRYYRGKD